MSKMQGLFNVMRMQARQAVGNRGAARVATVSSYDPNAYAVKVLLQPEEQESGWLPLVSPWVGNGWGLFAPPSIGDMIEVHYQEGSTEAGYACLRFYNDEDRPLAVPSGEFWLVHQSGSALKFTNDGDVLVVTDRDLIATVGRNLQATVTGTMTTSAANWSHTGNMVVTGNLGVTGGMTNNGKDVGSTHTHVGSPTAPIGPISSTGVPN